VERWFRIGLEQYGEAVPFVKPRRYDDGMSATEPRPQRADARRNRERIVAAAREVFAQCGQETQMDEIARNAGVGVGTVYRHFPTKDALVGELMRAKFAGHAEVARRWSTVEDGWAAFEGFLRETIGHMAQDATLQRMMWVTSEEAMDFAEPARLELSEIVGTMIVRAQGQGTLRQDFDVVHMPALMCAIGGAMSAQNSLVVDHWQLVVEVVIDGLRAR
jgi:AcrR family transcriptional regulator